MCTQLIPLLAAMSFHFYALAQGVPCTITQESEVRFEVDNLKINTVEGYFEEISGQAVVYTAQPELSTIQVTIPVSGIRTGIRKRDAHLLESEFFDAGNHPEIVMQSEHIGHAAAENRYSFEGKLRVKGIEKPVLCSFEVNPTDGGYVLSGSFALQRRDFDLGASYGSFTIGEEVRVDVSLHCNTK